MAGKFSLLKHSRCSLCQRSPVTIHLVVRARRPNGAWLTLYQMCWECGYEPLRQLACRPVGMRE